MGDDKIMNNEKYFELKNISSSHTPNELIESIDFKNAINIACEMLNNQEWDETLHEFATSILELLRIKYPEKWNLSWKYDALLGYAYNIILKYDERYEAYIRAIEKNQSPPPELLVALAKCCIAPGKPLLTEDKAIDLVKDVVSKVPYIEAVELLKGLYKSKGNIEEQLYWENIFEKIKDNGKHLPPINQICDDHFE